ncbi:hypothetical protein B484DRAFT_400335 [Ochromonadaceae sp. CCMP2298]|nr:hypothetical protein B484DRAFT_400335 [Ochromonadaceae sp. CCMP2298]
MIAPIHKKAAPPAECEDKDDDEKSVSIQQHNNNDSSDGSSGKSNPIIPLIPSWLLYANLERLALALETDFRNHPDNDGDYSPGSPNDIILCGKGKGGKVTDAHMRLWTITNPWINNKNFWYHFLDPTMWPPAWAYIPRTWIQNFYNIANKRTAKHNLPALWLAYFLSCPFTDDGKKRQPLKISDINQPSGIYPHTVNLADPSIKKRTFAAPDPKHAEPKSKRTRVATPPLSSDDSSDAFEDPDRGKRKSNTSQTAKKKARHNTESKPDVTTHSNGTIDVPLNNEDQFKLPYDDILKLITNNSQARAYNNTNTMPDLTESDSDSDNEEANTLYDNQASLTGATPNITQTPALVANTQTPIQDLPPKT